MLLGRVGWDRECMRVCIRVRDASEHAGACVHVRVCVCAPSGSEKRERPRSICGEARGRGYTG